MVVKSLIRLVLFQFENKWIQLNVFLGGHRYMHKLRLLKDKLRNCNLELVFELFFKLVFHS